MKQIGLGRKIQNAFSCSCVKKDTVWLLNYLSQQLFLIVTIRHPTKVRNKFKKGVNLDAVSFRSHQVSVDGPVPFKAT